MNLVFWALLYSGRDDLDGRWRWGLAAVWVALWLASSRIPGGDLFFMSLVFLDIILVMVILKGDVRIT